MKNVAVKSVILFDGVCNFCNSSVNFIIAHDPSGRFKFAPLQSEIGEKLLRENGISTIETDSVILIENGKAFTHSTAALRITKNLSGVWKLAYGFIILPKFFRDFAYRLFAKNRYRLFGRQEACMMPTPDIRARFLTTAG